MAEIATPPVAALRGTVTLLFTDVEGSTRLLQRFGDASVRLLEDHKRILRETIEEFGGREVDVAGDGFFIVFDVARDGVAAAVEAQRRLLSHPGPDGEPVRVRMGLHTGEPIVAGRQYLGLDVHRAARISAAGHGGQILISATTRHLVVNELPAGLGLRDLGDHTLKDLQHPEKVFQVVGPGLPLEFPPLKSIGPHRTNLPSETTRLVGREAELDVVRRLLLDDHVRLVTLTGPGGTGKTRLALHAAGKLVDAFSEGVILVSLVPTTDVSLVAPAIAQSLAVHTAGDESAESAIIDHLHDRELLLVLDNFEHLVGAADVVANVLAACPRVKALVTSRTALNLTVEREFPVPPLSAPDPKRDRALEKLSRYPAVELFVQRAAAVNPAFRLDEDNAAAVAEICYRLDGLPLAIELAAARVKIFPPRALLSRLDNRLELLSGGARDMPARHRTLRGAIGWSHDLLNADEQALFRRLSVFVSGCTLDAIEAVCEAAGPLSISPLEGVAALIDKSLLRQEATAEGEPRFGMLETIREYAVERLAASGEGAVTRNAHVDHFITLAEQAEPELTGPMQMKWLERLSVDHDNIRAAFAWAERTADAARGLRLGGAFWRFWVVRGHMTEGRARLRTLLALPQDDVPAPHRLKALAGAATMAHEEGGLPEARTLSEESLRIARASGDRQLTGRTLTNLSWVELQGGHHARSRELAQEGLAIARGLDDTRGIALALNNLAWVAVFESEFTDAIRLHEESLGLRRVLGDARGIAFAQTNLAWPLAKCGMFDRAESLLIEALETLRALSDQQLLSFALIVLGDLRFEQDRLAEAIVSIEEAVAHAREIGHAWDANRSLVLLCNVLVAQGDLEGARACRDQCIHAIDIDYAWIAAQSSRGVAEYARAAGHTEEALEYYDRALEGFGAMFSRADASECMVGLAAIAAARGEHERAATLCGIIGGMRAKIGSRLAPIYLRTLEPVERAARDALGDIELERARDVGAAMPWDDALRFARSAGAENPRERMRLETSL